MKRGLFILATLSLLLMAYACDDDDKDVTEEPEPEEVEEPDEVDEPEVDEPDFVGSPDILTKIDADTDIYGVVYSSTGKYLSGVAVSDGYSVAVTDANGVYQLTSCEYSYHVYVTLPAEYEVPMADGLPCFWQKLSEGQERYDFELTPLAGGAETEFNLFCIADPQCQTTDHVRRFVNETCPDILKEASSYSTPCYGVVLGDIGWNTASTDYNSSSFPLMKTAMREEYTGLPLFMCIGNHDNAVITDAAYSRAKDISAQRQYEETFGPVNYSFDRGDAHIIVMDDVYFASQSNYWLGFRGDQVEWLTQDLNNLKVGKLIILCVHIPIRNNTDASYANVKEVLELISTHCSFYHIMSGHIHDQEYTKDGKHYEHNHGAACGAWWRATICADGTPNGYAVYKVEGNEITNWYYKGTDCDRDFQIRLYHASDVFMPGYSPTYQFKYTGSNQIIANIWNGDDEWKVEVYEDGVYSGDMTGGNYTDRDAWASGYFIGVLGRSTGSDYDISNKNHYWYYTLKNANASTIEVVATDEFGNVYRQSKFTSNTEEDFPVAP